MNLVFIMNTPFPYGQAFSSRARNFTYLFNELGYHVHIIAPKDSNNQKNDRSQVTYSCEYVNSKKGILTQFGIGVSKPYMEALQKYAKKNKIDIIFSSSMIYVADEIQKYCLTHNIPYYMEQCEWFDASTFKGGRLNPYYREHIKRIKKKNKTLDGIIAISRLFFKHYTQQGVKCIRIPTILDKEQIKARVSGFVDNDIHLIFAGSLGNGKEQLLPIFSAMSEVKNRSKRIILDIYGPTEKQVLQNINNDISLYKSIKENVYIHGRIPQQEIEDKVRQADFSIFVRPNRKSSNAGFPTKLAESMMVGTPIITNNTGDISIYLKNNVNGFIINNILKDSLVKIFEYVLELSEEEYIIMRKNARKTAENYFDYHKYYDLLYSFLYQHFE